MVARRREDMADTRPPRRFMLALAASTAAAAFCAAASRRSRPPPPKLVVRSSIGLQGPGVAHMMGASCCTNPRGRAARLAVACIAVGQGRRKGRLRSPERHGEGQQALPLLVGVQRALVEAAAVHPAWRSRRGARLSAPAAWPAARAPWQCMLLSVLERRRAGRGGTHLSSQRSANLRARMCSSCRQEGAQLVSSHAVQSSTGKGTNSMETT